MRDLTDPTTVRCDGRCLCSSEDPCCRVAAPCGAIVCELAELAVERVVVCGVGPLLRQRVEVVVADVGGDPGCLPALERGCDVGSKTLVLARPRRLVALDELGQHLASEDLERLHDVLVPVAAGLEHEDHLVDTCLLVTAEELARLLRCAGATAQASGVTGGDLGTQPFLL